MFQAGFGPVRHDLVGGLACSCCVAACSYIVPGLRVEAPHRPTCSHISRFFPIHARGQHAMRGGLCSACIVTYDPEADPRVAAMPVLSCFPRSFFAPLSFCVSFPTWRPLSTLLLTFPTILGDMIDRLSCDRCARCTRCNGVQEVQEVHQVQSVYEAAYLKTYLQGPKQIDDNRMLVTTKKARR